MSGLITAALSLSSVGMLMGCSAFGNADLGITTEDIFGNQNDDNICMTITTHNDLDAMLEYISEIQIDE